MLFDIKLKKMTKNLLFVRVKRANAGSSQLSGNVMNKTKVPERQTCKLCRRNMREKDEDDDSLRARGESIHD